ncbi:MAG: acetyl-CoA acetyltransferase [Acidimicrobiales bacterium]|nr:acetyl-CoA acetyltransferase [Acidimicrobiales bacterium]
MAIDPRTPVLVGVGQRSQRVDRGEPPLEPVDLMVAAGEEALTDAGIGADALDSIRTVMLLSWRYTNAATLVSDRLGVGHEVDTAVTTMGGNSPQSLINQTALDVAAGRTDCALLTGAEAWRTRMAARVDGGKPDWTQEPDDTEPARVIGSEMDMSHEAEQAVGLYMPVQVYPMYEQARRHRLGRTLDEHLSRVGELWSRFSEVAADNPHAWIQEPMTAEEIITPTADNRLIGLPYTKVMNSNNAVEQGAAVIVCAAGVAERLGVPRDRWVFPLAGGDAHEHPYMSHRADLHSAPAIGVLGRAVLDVAGRSIDDVDHVDLYSCFPVAPQIGAEELGLDLDRQLTVTGGLAFAGGPWNNYVMHAVATLVGVLRDDPGATGLVWANGGYFTKHAIGLYSTEPPADGFHHVHPQDEIDQLPSREVSTDHEGQAIIETWVVMHDKDGSPETAFAALRLDDGRRAWGTTTDPDALKVMVTEEMIGRSVQRAADGQLTLG